MTQKMINLKLEEYDTAINRSQQTSWYSSYFDNAIDAVFIIQSEAFIVLDANNSACLLMKMTKDELIGTCLHQFNRIYKLLKKSNSPVILSELNLFTPDDINRKVEVNARFIEVDGQKIIQAIVRDISEPNKLTDKLVQADKLVLLGQLSAVVAHEIRNPLAAVLLNLQILKRDIPSDSAYFNSVDTALQGAERISRIVEVTLNFSKPSQINIQELDLNSIIPTSLDLVTASFRKKNITLDIKLEEELPQVSADAKQIQQVFINLLTNAADAIENQGVVKIRTYVEKTINKDSELNYAVVSVNDNGCGISPEDLSKIFNPFFTRKADGTGLGLPITLRILHQHNGIIDVESTLGKGTTFYVKLPIIKKSIE
jgi:signal transduction histidine kinase